jgi:hypothetical protein
MKVYRISKAKLDELRPSLMMRMAVVLAFTFAASALIAFRALGQHDLRLMLVGILVMSGTATFAVLNASRKGQAQLNDMASTFELVLDAGRLTRRQRALPEVTMDYSEIRRIEDYSRGLSITADSRLIGVSSAVENYDQLKTDLTLLTGIAITSKRNLSTLAQTYLPVLLVIGLFAISVMAQNRIVAASASLVLAAVVVASIVIIHRSLGVPRDLKRGLLLRLIAALALAARGVFLLLRH